jgi:hypothetical protein
MMRVMDRLNLTLDGDTYIALEVYAKKHGLPRAAVARQLVQEGLSRYEALERRRALARDYASERTETRDLLDALGSSQLELLERDDRE